MAVIEPNPHRTPKHLFTERGPGAKVTLHECYDDREEASYVVDAIAALVASGQAGPGDFAIMYRTNAQSRLLEESFLRAGLPYRLVGAQRFYGRREVKDVIAYLRLIHNPYDEASLLRVINTPPRRIGNKTILALRTLAGQKNRSPIELVTDLARGPKSEFWTSFPPQAAQTLGAFGASFTGWRAGHEDLKPLALMDRVLEDTGYRGYLDDGSEEGQDRWENVMELRRLAAEYGDRDLVDFLEDVALVSDQDTLDAGTKSPTLLTLHAAKGLEFPIVFIIGLQDGTLPHIRSFDDSEEMAEERRLFYVGITRAQNRLILVYALNRQSYGYSEPADASRFLEDIPETLLAGDHLSRLRSQPRLARMRLDRWEAAGAAAVPIQQLRYHPGDRIQHSAWGEGMVLNSKLEDDDEIVEIFFASVGKKRVSASIARLEIVP
jgi:DNA helicase-2/ATP-dependent DNA helicase PcrA